MRINYDLELSVMAANQDHTTSGRMTLYCHLMAHISTSMQRHLGGRVHFEGLNNPFSLE